MQVLGGADGLCQSAPATSQALAGLPPLHKDPFDRIVIAQAQAEGLGLVTSDRPLSDYPEQTIW